MKQIVTSIVFLVITASVTAQSLNFDAVEKYFEITENLKRDVPLSNATWKELLAFQGLKLYLDNQAFDSTYLEVIRKNIEYVYMPRYDSLRQVRLKDREKYWYTSMINSYKKDELIFKQYYKSINSTKALYLDSIYKRCYAMLPKSMQKKAATTTIYYIPIWNDAVAEGNDVIFTLYASYHFDKLGYGALGAHEFHHVLRKNKKNLREEDAFLFEALSNLLNEGSADLIDKKLTGSPDCPDDLAYYGFLMENGPNAMAILDTAIISHVNKIKAITKKDIADIVPMSGHIPGCYMSAIIERNGYKNEVVRNVDNPVQFILIYNKAAAKDKEKPYRFSDTTIEYIKKLSMKSQNSKRIN